MQKRKKILSIVVKTLIGLASLLIIYLRLGKEFTEQKTLLLVDAAFSSQGLLLFGLVLALIPVNWGIEAYKWKLITAPIQWVSYKTASKSVYSGVCLGNLAPGRATEFVAKIIFFKIENRPKITVLHFVGGMFQLSVTIFAGFFALLFRLQRFQDSQWLLYAAVAGGIVMLALLILCIVYINPLLNFISRKIKKTGPVEDFHYQFSPGLLLKLVGFSGLRYAVFCAQFCFILAVFHIPLNAEILVSVCLYFLITTLIPMISLLEAAIRAAIALLVFKDLQVSETALALSSVLIWLVNIILPSVVGYFFLLKQNFNFKLFKTHA